MLDCIESVLVKIVSITQANKFVHTGSTLILCLNEVIAGFRFCNTFACESFLGGGCLALDLAEDVEGEEEEGAGDVEEDCC